MRRHCNLADPKSANAWTIFLGVCCIAIWSCATVTSAPANDQQFKLEIAPLLQHKCVSCHNQHDRKGGLSLLSSRDWQQGGDSGPVIDSREIESSLLLTLVRPDKDGHALMPKDGQPLSVQELASFTSWIKSGAIWPKDFQLAAPVVAATDWWAFRPLVDVRVPVPMSSAAISELNNPVDAFVHDKHQEQGLTFSAAADRRSLIRRISFDLLGLPPTPDDVESFSRDDRPDAYERLVDRLLASPRLGERWARHWLDVVHFGDTHGYDKDKPRPNAWPYRDYVIRALNSDKAWSRFVQEQIAGDVMFPGTVDGIEALGFIAAGPWDFVGHAEVAETKIDGKIARHLDRDDMVRTTMQSFCSVTVGCAQCHQHKFDPIRQEDYYRLQAVFAAVDRADKPYIDDEKQLLRFNELKISQTHLKTQLASLEKQQRDAAGSELSKLDDQIKSLTASKQGQQPPEYGYHSQIAKRNDVVKWVQVDLGDSVALDRIVLLPCFDSFNNIGAGFGFPVRFKIELSDDASFRSQVRMIRDRLQETLESDLPSPGLTPQSFHTRGIRGRFVRVTATKLATRQTDYIFALAELQAIDISGANVALGKTVTAMDSIDAPPRWRKQNLVDGLMPENSNAEELAKLSASRDAMLAGSGSQQLRVALAERRAELKRLTSQLATLPPTKMVYAGTVHDGAGNFLGTGGNGGRPRDIFVLRRGDVTQPDVAAQPGALSLLTQLRADFILPGAHRESDRRSALAKWLTARENVLTWRSIVNRVWQYHFGRGLVETANDFGRMGALPTHPELLDWLAVDFRDAHQSLKDLHRRIVLSRTYTQSSTRPIGQPIDAPVSSDSDNRWLWRMNRRKLEAEAVRDSVLAVAGQLDLSMGGPAFQDFVIEKPEHSPHYEYRLHDPSDPRAMRRSVYRFTVRSQLQPFMASFDCADPSLQVDRRNESITPLQALTMLNNGLIVVMAQRFAVKLNRYSTDVEQMAHAGFLEVTGRSPDADELVLLCDYARQHGLVNLCRWMLNLSEFSFVD